MSILEVKTDQGTEDRTGCKLLFMCLLFYGKEIM